MAGDLMPFSMDRDPARVNPTEAALIGRGLDNETAKRLRRDGWTLGKLQQAEEGKLVELGLPQFVIDIIKRDARPAVPPENLVKVLFANRFTCCVCRDTSRAIIVHHIDEWAKSHSHEAGNLAVLCQEDHNRAHSVSTLTQNLDATKLKAIKAKWEAAVSRLDSEAILDASREHGDAWIFFNHLRLFQLAESLEIDFTKLARFQSALTHGLIDDHGALNPRSVTMPHMYDSGEGMTLYAYVRDVLHAMLRRISVINVSDTFDRGAMRAIVKEGDFILVQGLHRFKRERRNDVVGPGQVVLGCRKTNDVTVEFVFDRWHATSTSAWAGWLSGNKNVTSIVRVGTIKTDGGALRIEGTVFAIAQGFSGFQSRDYMNPQMPRSAPDFDFS